MKYQELILKNLEQKNLKGKKIKKSETIDNKNQKQDFNFNLSGIIPGSKINKPEDEIDIEMKKPKIDTNISGPNIKIDKEIPDIGIDDDFEQEDILDNLAEPQITLKEIFSGNIDDKNLNLNIIKQDLWGNEDFNHEESNNLNSLEINLSNREINTPSIEIPEIDTNLKIKNPNFNPNINANTNINKPEIKEDINLKIPDINSDLNINSNNKAKIGNDIDINIPKIQLEDKNKNINNEINNDKFIPCKTLKDLFSKDINDDIIHPKLLKNEISEVFQNLDLIKEEKEKSLNLFDDFDNNIDFKAPEIEIPNIKLKGMKNNLNIKIDENVDNNNDIDVPDINIKKEEINLKVDLPKKDKNEEIKKNF